MTKHYKTFLKGILIVFISLTGHFSFAQTVVPKMGVAYSQQSTILDQTFGAMFGFTYMDKSVELTGDFIYYFDEVRDGEYSPYSFNFDIRYISYRYKDKYKVYPILGVNYPDIFRTTVGLNAGIGTTLNIGKYLSIYSDYKYIFGDMDGSTLSLGVQFKYPY